MNKHDKITLDDVVLQLNPHHTANTSEDIKSARGVVAEQREAFFELLIGVMNPEGEDVRDWDKVRWERLVAFSQDLSNFLRYLDSYYRQQRNK
jgi:hypothetical protein